MATQLGRPGLTASRILAESTDALVLVDGRLRIVFANAQTERLFGHPRAELVGQPMAVLLPALAGSKPSVHALEKVARDGALCGKKRDGVTVPVEMTVETVQTAHGLFYAAWLKELLPATALSSFGGEDQRFELALEEAPIGMALVGLDGTFLRVNRALCAIVGYSRDELTGCTFQAITHPDDLRVDVELAADLASGKIPRYSLPKRYVRKDGSVAHVMLHGTVARDTEGRPLYYIAQVEDISERIAAEETLRRSEAAFRSLVAQASDAVFVADLDGRYTQVNDAACRMLGYARDELLGKTIVDLIRPEDVPRLAAQKDFLAKGNVNVTEWILVKKDGTGIPTEVSAQIHPDGRWVAFVRDISERKQTEEALRRTEASLARAQRAAHLGTWDWDLRTNHVERSKELLDLFGVAGDVSPKRWAMADYIHPDDRERVKQHVDAAAAEARPYTLEHRILRPDGTERVVLQHGEPIFEGEKVVRVVGTLLDVTERRRAEREREATLGWLRGVIDHSPVGIVLLHGPKGLCVEANSRARALMGRSLEYGPEAAEFVLDATGAPVPVDELPGYRALRGEDVEWTEYQMRQPNGTILPVRVGAAAIRSSTGEILGSVVVFEDISETKELERLRAEWGSVVAHDLRQPLGSMVLQARLLLRGELEPETRHAVQRMEAAGMRLNRMVGDLMDLSRLDARRLELRRGPHDVVKLVHDCADRFGLEAPDRHVHVRVEGVVPRASIDADRISQILDNLLSNALKYGARRTPIVITVAGTASEVSVAVTNEGRGIAAEELPRLFRRFQRATDVKGTRIKGVGLGLYITRELVEAHGGRLTVESTPGATTTFRFTLPLAAS